MSDDTPGPSPFPEPCKNYAESAFTPGCCARCGWPKADH